MAYAPAMTMLDRRKFLGGTAAVAGALALPGMRTGLALPGLTPAEILTDPFTLGVSSGDPLPGSVILWTRLAIDPINGGGMGVDDIPVQWQVATDDTFATVVASGTANATADAGHSVHVDATGLAADTIYRYRFQVGTWTSPVGTTRTTPPAGSSPSSLRFGFASCQNFTNGYYAAHRHLAAEDIDVLFFLGDFIYESGGSGVRAHTGGECLTLTDYRNRYALYMSDADLRSSRAAFPWIVVWDDHEVDNDYADDAHDGGDPPETFLARRAAAYQAYYEHMPLRIDPPDGADLVVYRSVEIGTLATMFVLDTRQYRDDQACKAEEIGGTASPLCDEATSPDRTILGTEQREWLTAGLTSNTARWNILANQVVFSKLPILGELFNMDQWDGYSADRDIVLEAMSAAAAPTIVVTGDIHLAGAATVRQDFADKSSTPLGVEFVGTSISSSFGEELYPFVDAIAAEVPWIEYVNPRSRGYCVVTLTPDEARADYRIVASITEPTSTISTDRSFTVAHDDPRLVEA